MTHRAVAGLALLIAVLFSPGLIAEAPASVSAAVAEADPISPKDPALGPEAAPSTTASHGGGVGASLTPSYDYRPDVAREPLIEAACYGYDTPPELADPSADGGRVRCGSSGLEAERVAPRTAPGLADDVIGLSDRAAGLQTRAGRNRVSIETPSGRMSVDLQGGSHYERTLGRSVETPHVKFETRHVGPNGRVSYTSGPVRPATFDDLRLVDRILRERGL